MDAICHIITKLELGGAQEVALHAVSHLDRSKYRAMLIAGPGGILTEEARRLPHVDVRIIPALGRQIRLIGDMGALIQLTKLLRRLRPGVVHTHSSKAGVLGRWAAWLAGVPVIVHTVHGYGITPAQPRWLRSLLVLAERITGWVTTHWITVSQADLKKGRAWGLFRDNVLVIRPGIDPEQFQRQKVSKQSQRLKAELGGAASDKFVGTVACLKPQKAPQDFIAVAKRVIAARSDVHFVLVGDGELRPQVEALIAQYGLSGRVHLAGWRRDVPAMMQAWDAFLLTSHWEGLPRVLLEARVSGLPIIATDVGGADEVVTDPSIGSLRQAGDVQGLADTVLHVLGRGEARASIPKPALTELPAEFHISETVRQYELLYDRLLHPGADGIASNRGEIAAA